MDPLNINIDIANHDASRPLLPEGQYSGILKSAGVVPSKNAPGNFNLLIEVATTEEQTSTKGTPLRPGFSIRRWFPLQASEKQIEAGMENSWKDQLAVLVDGLFQSSQGNRPALDQALITQMSGMPVVFATKVTKDDTYGDGNELGRIAAAA